MPTARSVYVAIARSSPVTGYEPHPTHQGHFVRTRREATVASIEALDKLLVEARADGTSLTEALGRFRLDGRPLPPELRRIGTQLWLARESGLLVD